MVAIAINLSCFDRDRDHEPDPRVIIKMVNLIKPKNNYR